VTTYARPTIIAGLVSERAELCTLERLRSRWGLAIQMSGSGSSCAPQGVLRPHADEASLA